VDDMVRPGEKVDTGEDRVVGVKFFRCMREKKDKYDEGEERRE